MSAALRLHDPDRSTDSAEPPPLLSLSAEQMRALAKQISLEMIRASPPPATHVETPMSPSDALRLSEPGVILSLRDCFESDRSRNSARREPNTWADYLSTVETLESAWGRPGPDVRTLTPSKLQSAFASVSEWKSRSTWIKRRKYLVGMLRSCTRQTTRNPHGVPKSESALLTEDDLPIWELPAEKWFLSRGAVGTQRLPALSVEEFSCVLTACSATNDPLWWRSLLSLWWFCAMRRDDTLFNLCWTSPTARGGVDLGRRWLTYRAAKPPHETFDIPLPEWLCVGLRALQSRPRQQSLPGIADPQTDRVFWRPTGASKLSRWLYPTLKLICATAGLDYRDPTAFRQCCSTHWDEHDPQFANRFTAHKESSVLKLHYVHRSESQLRAAADRHPQPSVPLVFTDTNRSDAAPSLLS